MFRPDPKPEPREKKKRKPLKRSPLKYKKEPTGERNVFAEILKERGAISQISGTRIGFMSPANFIHVLAKGQNKFPKFKLYKKNIIIGTWNEHHQYDNGSHEELRKNPLWKWVFKLRDELIEEYKKL